MSFPAKTLHRFEDGCESFALVYNTEPTKYGRMLAGYIKHFPNDLIEHSLALENDEQEEVLKRIRRVAALLGVNLSASTNHYEDIIQTLVAVAEKVEDYIQRYDSKKSGNSCQAHSNQARKE